MHFDDDDEVQNNEPPSAYFKPMDNVYPIFFQGSLENACQTAFGTSEIQGVRSDEFFSFLCDILIF